MYLISYIDSGIGYFIIICCGKNDFLERNKGVHIPIIDYTFFRYFFYYCFIIISYIYIYIYIHFFIDFIDLFFIYIVCQLNVTEKRSQQTKNVKTNTRNF